MKQAIDNIILRIAENSEAFTQRNLIAPQTMDIYLGQPTAPDQFEFDLPAIFIDYMADYANEKLYFYLHVLQDYEEDTEHFAQNRADGMRFNDYLTVIKRLLNGVKMGGAFGVLKLYQELPVQTEFYYYHQITLACNLYTDLYAQEDKYIDAEPVSVFIEHGTLKERAPLIPAAPLTPA